MTVTTPRDRAASERSSKGNRLVETTFRRKVLGLAAFVILVGTVLNAFFGERGVLSLMKAREEYLALEVEVEGLEIDNDNLENEIVALRTDPLVVERIARETLGMAKEGEVVLTIRTPPESREESPRPERTVRPEAPVPQAPQTQAPMSNAPIKDDGPGLALR
jgi:cell division protein FtsB